MRMMSRNSNNLVGTVMATARFYWVSAAQAQADIARLRQVLSTWEDQAKLLDLSAEDRAECRRRAGPWTPSKKSYKSPYIFFWQQKRPVRKLA